MGDNQVQEKQVVRLPKRAWNLAMRALAAEKDNNGRCRLTFDVIMNDGDWLLTVTKPGRLENLSE